MDDPTDYCATETPHVDGEVSSRDDCEVPELGPSPDVSLHFYYDNPSSMRRYRECNQAADVKLALWEFDQELRRRYKYGEEGEQMMLVDQVRGMLWKMLHDHGIDLDDE